MSVITQKLCILYPLILDNYKNIYKENFCKIKILFKIILL